MRFATGFKGLLSMLMLSSMHAHSWDIFGEALLWKASEEPSAIWTTSLSELPGNTTVFEPTTISFDWDVGFRVGGGYTFDHDGWDSQLFWTHFETESNTSLPENGDIYLIEFFGGFVDQATPSTKNVSRRGKIKWLLNYNMIDWQLARSCTITPRFTLRPHIGLKGGWIDQSINSKWQNVLEAAPFTRFSAKERVKNDFGGVGPSVGVTSAWKALKKEKYALSCMGSFGAAFMWGSWRCNDVYTNSLNARIPVTTNDAELGALMFSGFLGISFDRFFTKGYISIKLGYDTEFWLSQLRIATFEQLRLHGDLSFQGAVFSCQVGF